jgi:predicted ABC-type ATPase
MKAAPHPRLIVIAGPNGAGKTSLTTQVLQHQWLEGCVYVNPDNIARDVFGDWNSAEAIIKAAKHAEAVRKQCLAERKNLAFESVFSSLDKLEFLRAAKAAGYFIRLFFVGTDDPSINAARIARRVMEGGHDVPIPKIISRYTRSIGHCATVAGRVDRLYVYDNSVDNEIPALLFRASAGKIVKTYRPAHDWAKAIINACDLE